MIAAAYSLGVKVACKFSSHMKFARLKATEEAETLQCMLSKALSTTIYVRIRVSSLRQFFEFAHGLEGLCLR